MSTGYSGTPLAKKLGIRDRHRVWLAGPPEGIDAELAPLPAGAIVRRTGAVEPSGADAPPGAASGAPGDGGRAALTLPATDLPDDRFDVILLFCPDSDALRKHFAAAMSRLRWAGGLWVCWPKKSSPLYVDLAREEVREVGLASGLVDNKVCAVDADWSGLRFVVRTEDRPDADDGGGPTL